MSDKLVSVIIPVYKVEAYLDRCVQSVFKQTYKCWEMILVDDGSPDNCGTMCDAYAVKDKRIRVIHQKNQGLSMARNAGLEVVKGDFIYFLDSDDYIAEECLKTCVEFLEDKQLDIVWFGTYSAYKDGTVKKLVGAPFGLSTKEIIREIVIKHKGNFSVWNKMYRAWVWKDLRFRPGIKLEDTYSGPDVLTLKPSIGALKEYFYFYYRENENSIMNDLGNKWIEMEYYHFLAWKNWCKYLKSYDSVLLEILLPDVIKLVLKLAQVHKGIGCFNAIQYKELADFLLEYKEYGKLLSGKAKIMHWAYFNCSLLTQLKAWEYRMKYQ